MKGIPEFKCGGKLLKYLYCFARKMGWGVKNMISAYERKTVKRKEQSKRGKSACLRSIALRLKNSNRKDV